MQNYTKCNLQIHDTLIFLLFTAAFEHHIVGIGLGCLLATEPQERDTLFGLSWVKGKLRQAQRNSPSYVAL